LTCIVFAPEYCLYLKYTEIHISRNKVVLYLQSLMFVRL